MIDLESGQLTRGDRSSFVQPKPLALLRRLLDEPRRFVSKQELRESVWPGVTVTDAALTSALRDLRRALGDDGTNPRLVETRRRRGVRLLRAAEPVADGQAAPPAAPALIGRDDLLLGLDRQLERAHGGQGQVVFLSGEPGVGKSRLALALGDRARALGFGIHAGHALEAMGAPPFRPWIQILRTVVGARRPAEIEPSLAGAAEEALVDLLGGTSLADDAGPGAEDPHDRFFLLEAAERLLRAAAREQPRLVILEDLHRADPASLLLLRLVAEEVADVPLLVLGTLRSLEADRKRGLERILAEPPSTVALIAVAGLEAEATAALVAETAGREAAPDVVAQIHARTGGNPLFVQEITRTLLAEGGLAGGDAVERAARAAPEGVRQVIRRRIARLPEDVRRMLERASVAGRAFDRSLVEHAWPETDPGDLAAAVRVAVEAGILTEAAPTPGGVSFVHDLFRECLYDGIPVAERSEMHARIGRTLERRGNLGQDGWLDALAHHFGEAAAAGEAERAAHWGRRAAARAIELTAYEDAAAHAARALDATAGDEPAADRAELLNLLGRARWLSGAPEGARQAFRGAVEAAEAAGADEVFARAALGFLGPTDATPGVNHEGVALLERALARLPDADHPLRAELLARLGTELYYGADPTRSLALTEASVAMAERLGDEPLLAYALSAQGYASLRPEIAPAVRLALAERVVTLAERNGAENTLALGLQERILAQLELADGPGVEKSLEAYDRLSRRLGQPFLRWLLGLYRGMRALACGQVEEAERLALESFARADRLGTPNAFGAFAAQLYGIRTEQGRLAELDDAFVGLAQEHPDMPVFRVAGVAVAAACGRDTTASLERIFALDLDALPRDQNWLSTLAVLADVTASRGSEAMAARLVERLAPHAGQIVVTAHGAGLLGAVRHHLGRLCMRLGDVDAAVAHFEAATAMHERLAAPLWTAHSQREHARALRDAGGDAERAQRIAASAQKAYRGFGLDPRRRQALASTAP